MFWWQTYSSIPFFFWASLLMLPPPSDLNLDRGRVLPSLTRLLHFQPRSMEHSCPVSPVDPLQYARHIRTDREQAGGEAGRQAAR